MTHNPYISRGYSLSALRQEARQLVSDLDFLEAVKAQANARADSLPCLGSPAITGLRALAEEAERIIVDEIEPCARLLDEAITWAEARAA